MFEFDEWADSVRENGAGIVTAVVGVGAVFGLGLTEIEGQAVVDSVAEVVVAVGAAMVAVNVVISKFKAALKSDEDIDTGPTTPGPMSDLDED